MDLDPIRLFAKILQNGMVQENIWPRFAIAKQYFLPLYEAVDEWHTSTCLWCWNLFKVHWLGDRFSAIFFIKSLYIYIYNCIYLFIHERNLASNIQRDEITPANQSDSLRALM